LIVVDASLFAAWLLNEPRNRSSEAVWDRLVTETAFVPAHWPNEMANTLRRAVRTKRIAEDEILPTVNELAAFDIRLAPRPGIDEIGALSLQALDLDISVYDLIYVRLAQAHGLPLATLDAGMRRAALKLQIVVLPDSE
jgi:predicted nucleic acid-binding protein